MSETLTQNNVLQRPNILTIAGSDSGAGAGIQADLKTTQAIGCYGLTAITALTAQNGLGVDGIFPTSAEFLALQLQTLKRGFTIASAKTGMLFSAKLIHVVSESLAETTFPLVVDPVAISQTGHKLLQDTAIDCLKSELFQRADVLTPNIPEAEMLTNVTIAKTDDLLRAGEQLLKLVKGAVIIKGGHLDGQTITDCLFTKNAKPMFFTIERVKTSNNHGTGCTFSSALACYLGLKYPLVDALQKAQYFVSNGLAKGYNPGQGTGPVNHAWATNQEQVDNLNYYNLQLKKTSTLFKKYS